MAIFTGAGVAIVTPFDDNYNVDYESFGKLIDYQIENKTDAIIVCGTTGEASTLSHEEHISAIRYCVNRTKKRVPVIAGTGSNDTRTAVYLTREAEYAGADAALIVSPYYNKATQKGLIDHFSHIAKKTSLPIIVYNIPGRTGCKIETGTMAKLVKDVGDISGCFLDSYDIIYILDQLGHGTGFNLAACSSRNIIYDYWKAGLFGDMRKVVNQAFLCCLIIIR